MTEIVMPNDTNVMGNLMGGNLLKWMDIAAGICATRHADSPVVTAAVDNVSFREPILLGDVVTITANVTRAFNTSMEVYLQVHVANHALGRERKMSNDAYYTMVAFNTKGEKIPVPSCEPETENEKKLYDGALRRRELRLILGGRMKPGESTELKSLFLES